MLHLYEYILHPFRKDIFKQTYRNVMFRDYILTLLSIRKFKHKWYQIYKADYCLKHFISNLLCIVKGKPRREFFYNHNPASDWGTQKHWRIGSTICFRLQELFFIFDVIIEIHDLILDFIDIHGGKCPQTIDIMHFSLQTRLFLCRMKKKCFTKKNICILALDIFVFYLSEIGKNYLLWHYWFTTGREN